MRAMILGAGGMLGHDLVAAARPGIVVLPFTRAALDITDPTHLTSVMNGTKPDLVINAAAYTDVERAEAEPESAFRANAVGALYVARAARDVGARCVFVSTDYVFDGKRDLGTAYKEEDAVRPLNVYGASKAAGEHLVIQTLENHLVVRLASLFGVAGGRGKGGNFIETILRKAREGGPLRVVNDQWMTPTYTADAAAAIVRLALSGARGVMHVTNPESCTWHAFASEAVSLAGLGVPVEPVSVSAFPSKVRRPRNSALDTQKLASLLGASLRPWREALRAYLVGKGHVT